MSQTDQQPTIKITDDIKQYIEDGNHLVTYVAKEGQLDLPETLTCAMVEAKFKAASGTWTQQNEIDFLLHFDQLARLVYPVTVTSIKALISQQNGQLKGRSQALNAVIWYRRATFFSLGLLLLAQLYWLIGNNLRINLRNIFNEIETIHTTTNQTNVNQQQRNTLHEDLALANQKLDANYQLLKMWNRVSSLGLSYEGELPEYTKERLKSEHLNKSAKSDPQSQSPHNLNMEQKLYEARIIYFKNILAADFFLQSFQSYFLPLLYGLLGAFIYVLRCLNRDIKALVYTRRSEINYRLRLTLGALGGMIIGWFFKPQATDAMASLSPMALAFLMGYNVDVLFSIMDQIMDKIRHSIGEPSNPAARITKQDKQKQEK